MSQKAFVAPIEGNELYRLFNLGGTVLVEAQVGDDLDVMPASWACPVDFNRMSVIIDSSHYTRKLMDASEYFLLAVPGSGIQKELLYLGAVSKNDEPQKVNNSGIRFFNLPDCEFPLPEGCAGWALIRKIHEPRNEKTYDMFIGDIVKAWSDTRVFSDNHWHLENGPDALRSLHYVSGGHFYEIGKAVEVTL